jgi:AAA+ ATPase superfamily predicted ATPase
MGRVRSVELFPTDGPIAPNRMIGRQGDLADLVLQVGNGVNRVLAGPRRTGKTTVAHGALEQLKRGGSYIVAVDLFRVADQADLAERIVDEVIANRSILRRAARGARTAGRTALTTAQVAATVKARSELGDSIEIAYSPGLASGDPGRHLAGAFEMLQRIAVADQRQVVLFIDEFQEIAGPRAPFGDPDQVTKQMRAILTRSDRVTCLFAGSVEHLLKGLFNDKRRALYQLGVFVSLVELYDV